MERKSRFYFIFIFFGRKVTSRERRPARCGQKKWKQVMAAVSEERLTETSHSNRSGQFKLDLGTQQALKIFEL